ncbi:YciI family protein [Nocardia huaxiensis]|uniref:Transcriptional regulator n=1 Tax=Nocardia huaxiensis TaxID=2755382 RepID=A0A7D6ZCI9_9NOCA|nr:YciI family protein [Nocardia huaxiensis]QLY32168.1 transcriptional regulator [Nocardia huaxiensis]UFS94132.1 YciI family protein [Nocardia huaxiensis]
MRHMVLIRLDPTTIPEGGPDADMVSEITALLEEMTKAGVLLDTNGLRPIEEATRLRQRPDGSAAVVDGPFTETKEIIGGYLLLQTRSTEEATEWSSRFLRLHDPSWDVELELRQLDHQD